MSSPLSAAELSVLFKGDVTGLQQVLAQAEAGIDQFGGQATASMRAVAGSAAVVDAGFGRVGLSSRQMSAAMRGLPAQFTDIFVSLQGGQNPMTVFLQQGGQLKDMFGGVGAAAHAMTGYVVAMVNPFSLSAAAAGAAAVAAYQGAAEYQAFNKTLIMTGGTAGVTADQLMSMASGMDAFSESVTQSKAAEVLNHIVATGVRGEAQIKRYSLAAAEFEEAGGGAAAKVAEQFELLGRDPLQASLKLTQSMGYLTTETYAQIQALDEQGRLLDAAKVAQDAYATAIETRTPALVENIGFIESAWRSVDSAMAHVWDTAKNIGRDDTLQDQIGKIGGAIDSYQRLASGGGLLGQFGAGQIESLKRQQEALKRTAAAQLFDAKVAAQQAQSQKDGIAWLQVREKHAAKNLGTEREVARARQIGLAAGASELEIEETIAAIRAASSKAGSARVRSRREERDEFAELYSRVTLKDVGLDPSFYKDLNTLHAGYEAGRITIDEYRGAVEALTAKQEFARNLSRESAAAIEVEDKFRQIVSSKERVWAGEIDRRNKAIEESIADIQFEARLLGMNTEQREVAIAMLELERKGVMAGTAEYQKYAAQIQHAIADRQARQEMLQFWQQVEGTAQSVFMDIAMNGEDAFRRIGESIKREVIQMLYEMTLKKWIIQVSGSYGGAMGGGGNSWVDLAQQAYSYYSGGGAAAGSTYALASGSGSGMGLSAGAAGVGLKASGGTGLGYTASTTSAGSGAGAGASSATAAAGWAAFIYAMYRVADNAYEKGWNENSSGIGKDGSRYGQSYSFGRTSFNHDLNVSDHSNYGGAAPTKLLYEFDQKMGLGLSSKWAYILSGMQSIAVLFGRKLGAYGYEANIAGGDAEISGFARYKGGLFRSNKTVGVDIDQRDAAAVDAIFESTIEGSRAMAKAMGYNSEAIDSYTGSLKVNMKGADTTAEQSERMAKAMDDLHYSLLNAASGGKLARAEFDRMMDGVNQSIEAAGISSQGMADIITQGMLGRLSQAQVGEQLGEMVIGGVYNMIVSPFAQQISQAFMAQIIQPMVMAVTTGGSISAAVSQATIQSVVAQANAAASHLTAILSDPTFRAAMAGIQTAITGISAASVRPARAVRSYGSALNRTTTAANAAREAAERLRDSWSGLFDGLIDEVRRLRGEILGVSEAGSAYNMAQFAAATAAARAGDQKAADSLPDLSRAVEESYRLTAQSRADLQAIRGYLLESNQVTANAIAGRFGFAIPQFDVGTNYVPRDMLAMIHEGEAVVPRAYNPAAGGSDPAMVSELRALRAEVASLRAEVKRGADASASTAINIDDIAKRRRQIATVQA